jgi:hypothetical protein
MLVRFELEITEFIELWHLLQDRNTYVTSKLQDKLLLQYAEDEQMLEFMTNNIK